MTILMLVILPKSRICDCECQYQKYTHSITFFPVGGGFKPKSKYL